MIIKADLHIHSKYSLDGVMGLDRVLRAAKKQGIKAVAIADHNTCSMQKEILPRVDGDGCIDGIVIVPAVEISTDAGHLLGLFINKEINFLNIEKNGEVFFADAAITEIKAADGIAVLAHPFGKPSWKSEVTGAHLFDGVECYNARAAQAGKISNKKAVRLAAECDTMFTAGSDAHFAQEIGNAALFLEVKEKTLTAVRAAVLEKQGTVWGRESPGRYRALSQVCKRIKAGQATKVPKRLLVMIYFILIDIAKTTRLLGKDRGSKLIEGGDMNVGDC